MAIDFGDESSRMSCLVCRGKRRPGDSLVVCPPSGAGGLRIRPTVAQGSTFMLWATTFPPERIPTLILPISKMKMQ